MRTSNRPLIVWALVLVFALVLSACAAPVAAPVADDAGGEAVAASDLKVGLVTDVGRINDRSFNQSAWEGVQQAATALGATEENVKYIETQDAKDYADNMQQFIDADYDVIVTVGFALGEATAEAAAEQPGHQLHRRRPVPGRRDSQPDRPDLPRRSVRLSGRRAGRPAV